MSEKPPEGLQLHPDKEGERSSDVSREEEAAGWAAAGAKEPSAIIRIPLGKLGALTFRSKSESSVLAIIMLVLLLVTLIIIVIVGAFITNNAWILEIAKIIGQGILIIIGYIFGNADVSLRNRD